jgi:hypothetical protein
MGTDDAQQPAAIVPPSASTPPVEPRTAINDGPAKKYLQNLLKEIEIMLDFAGCNGITLSDELHKKIDDLVNDPDVKSFDLFRSRIGRG